MTIKETLESFIKELLRIKESKNIDTFNFFLIRFDSLILSLKAGEKSYFNDYVRLSKMTEAVKSHDYISYEFNELIDEYLDLIYELIKTL